MRTNLNTFNSVVLECLVIRLRNAVQVKICLRLVNLSNVKAFPFGSTFKDNIPKITLCNLCFILFFPYGATVSVDQGFTITLRHTTLGRTPLDE
jgi:hypothetical protein